MKKVFFLLASGLVIGTGLLLALWIYSEQGMKSVEKQYSDFSDHDQYYVLISQDRSDLWSTVYESAAACAKEHNAVLDWIGLDAPVGYSVEDCMRIAASSGASGIILHQETPDDLTDLINEAARKEIPVITVLNDDSDSERISFVGVNNYQMGEICGRQVIDSLHEGKNEIMVLNGEGEDDGSFGLMYTQMLQVVDSGKTPDQEVVFQTQKLNTQTSFDTEEGIRDIFLRVGALPDVIVCLNPIVTECVAQALVDYNQVGGVTVIGYHDSDTILDAVSKGLIKATLSIDAEEIGELCVEALDEYWTLGRVSDYFNVGISMITQDDIPETEKEGDPSEEEGDRGSGVTG